MFANTPEQPKVVSVTRLNRLARQILESEIGQIWVSGEISNFVAASSGHWYFTLKDNKAQVRTAMFKGANRFVKNRPKEGDKVIVRANLSIYEARGDYQLIAEHLEPEGMGQLKQAFELLKQKLSALGLFAMERKKPIPSNVKRIGLVTSPTGAAVHDILTVLKRRNPSIDIILYPSLVQGDQAASSIVKQIEKANIRKEVDVLIVGRGGGSLEDLWAFNEEIVAYAIYHSKLPVVSAVGHEVDITIADYVADLRAPTPSAAAELVSNDKSHVLEQLSAITSRLVYSINNQIMHHQHSLVISRNRLQANHPTAKISQAMQNVDRLSIALTQSLNRKINEQRKHYQQLTNRLHTSNPIKTINNYQRQVEQRNKQLINAQRGYLQAKNKHLNNIAQLLNSVSPLATLSRGYSISFDGDKVIKSVKDVSVDQDVRIKLVDGEVTSRVLKTSISNVIE